MARFFGCLLALVAATFTVPAHAQSAFPNQPIRFVIPFAPGGFADVSMRILGQKLSEIVGQQVIMDNKPGAGGIVAAQAVTSARPDGHTLMVLTNGTAITKSLFKSLPYDPVADFTPVSIVAYFDVLLLVNGKSPHKTLGDLLAAGKSKGSAFNIGTINPGSTQNLTGELFKSKAGLTGAVVPFRGTPDVLTALLRDEIDVGFETYAPLKAQIDAGDIRPVATTSDKRTGYLPNLPTARESGLPTFEVVGWNALVAPKGTPRAVIDVLNRHIQTIVALPDFKQRMIDLGADARASTPEELGARFNADIAKWAEVIRDAKIELQ
jgi:tripartite-type tricarboxylate transporter receptor subunit TctC